MPVQVQCPNCGGYKVSTSNQYVNPFTRKKVSVSKASGRLLALFIAIALVFLDAYLTPFIGARLPIYDTTTAIIITIFLVLVVPIIVCVLILKIFADKRRKELAQAVKMKNSSCALCGYSWEWLEGHPRTDIQVDPEKMQRGERRLEQERLAEKRRQDNMAAWYMQQQRDKK
jgi:rubredoxin